MMMGACNTCGGPNPGDDHDRQVVGTNDSYTYRADFPPSYSTGISFTSFSNLIPRVPLLPPPPSFPPDPLRGEMEGGRETLGTSLYDQQLMITHETVSHVGLKTCKRT